MELYGDVREAPCLNETLWRFGFLATNAVVLTNAREGGSVALTPNHILGLTAISREIPRGPGPLQKRPCEPLRGPPATICRVAKQKRMDDPSSLRSGAVKALKNKGL